MGECLAVTHTTRSTAPPIASSTRTRQDTATLGPWPVLSGGAKRDLRSQWHTHQVLEVGFPVVVVRLGSERPGASRDDAALDDAPSPPSDGEMSSRASQHRTSRMHSAPASTEVCRQPQVHRDSEETYLYFSFAIYECRFFARDDQVYNLGSRSQSSLSSLVSHRSSSSPLLCHQSVTFNGTFLTRSKGCIDRCSSPWKPT